MTVDAGEISQILMQAKITTECMLPASAGCSTCTRSSHRLQSRCRQGTETLQGQRSRA